MRTILRSLRAAIPVVVAVLILAGTVPAGAAGLTDHQRAVRGARYIASKQLPNGSIPAFSTVGSTADAVLALVASRQGSDNVSRAVRYLRRHVADNTSVGLQAKTVMAIVAGGSDPRHVNGANMVAALKALLGNDGHYGSTAVLDDALVVLALESAGAPPPSRAYAWLLTAQCPDGGWSYDAPYNASTDDAHCFNGDPVNDYFTSDSNTTAYVIMGLEDANRTGWGADPFAFFDTVRDPGHHGWSYSAGFVSTDANSTALVIQAYVSASIAVPGGGLQALRGLQLSCGAWAYNWSGGSPGPADIGATIGAVVGIEQAPLPVGPGGFDTVNPAKPPACT
ncbi:MAG: hypothetical protein QOE83_2489 [Actinomycetota bacterium]|jgi:hypothetical protein|nr:hypothetical protein [Actinomycetota bacterium]